MRWFTADTHFGHEKIIKMMARVNISRQLFSISEHDQYILDVINSKVGRDDELFVLGDFAWDSPGKYRAKINCKNVKLVRGNHDKVEKSLNVFGSMPDTITTKARKGNDSITLVLTHYPNAFWDGSHRGWGHLYGHCHGQQEETLDTLFPERRAFDVGLDNVYRLFGEYAPLSEVQVFDYLAKRSGHDDIRFYEDYQLNLYIERGLISG